MLDHLRARIEEALKQPETALLITQGAGGLQASAWPSEAHGLRLYLLVPTAADHLLNLETCAQVVVMADNWRLEGKAERLATLPGLALTGRPEAPWSVVVEVRPERLHMLQTGGWGDGETLVIDE
jgi:hypothetical protein